MTTSNPLGSVVGFAPFAGAGLPTAGGLEGLTATQAGAPDPAIIAQLANAFFSALPGQSQPSVGVAPPGLPGFIGAPPGDAKPPATPSVPGVGHVSTAPSPPPQLGPQSGLPQPPPGNPTAVPPVTTPSDADLRGVPGQLGNIVLLVPPDRVDASSPTALGAATGPADSFYFLDAGRPTTGNQASPAAPFKTTPQPKPQATPLALELRPELVPHLGLAPRPFDPRAVRRDFPILQEQVNGKPLIWLDNAATTQKPQAVIDRLSYFYEHENSNIHRAAHALAARATDAYEAARDKVRRFLGASSPNDIIFVRGATEGINLVAQAWGRHNIEADDEIIVTWLEHHANIVPWQQLCAEKGARLKVAPVDDSGQILLDEYEKLFTSRTKLVALTQVSNALGTITPAQEMVEIAHRHGACVLVDGAQAVSHMRVDVQTLGCDFYVFSGHKVFGPTGIGAVYGRPEVLAAMQPWQGGGNMIADVTFEKTVYQPPPNRFEAGTGNIADAVGLGAAIDYVEQIGMETIARYEHELLVYATQGLLTVPGLTMIGTAAEKASVLSFVLDGFRTEDVGKALDKEGIAVRSGHHCAQPILRRFGLEATVRPSLAFYNTCEDVDALVAALHRLQAGRG
jgi:cysteine desulfurase/selenocysteine lyase